MASFSVLQALLPQQQRLSLIVGLFEKEKADFLYEIDGTRKQRLMARTIWTGSEDPAVYRFKPVAVIGELNKRTFLTPDIKMRDRGVVKLSNYAISEDYIKAPAQLGTRSS